MPLFYKSAISYTALSRLFAWYLVCRWSLQKIRDNSRRAILRV